MKDYRRGNHCIHKLAYHMVFVTKFRKPLISGETDKNHMHLLVWLPPNCCISDVIRSVKTQLSKDVRVLFNEDVINYLHDNLPFWSPSI